MAGLFENVIQDQIILAPEIMSMILENLDLRSLKKVRLVCKSWLLEAQAHMVEKRGLIVRLNGNSFPNRVRKFLRTRKNNKKKLLPDDLLPQPFHSFEVDVGSCSWPPEKLTTQLFRSLVPPLLIISRFTPGELRMRHVVRILKQHSSTLEYLRLALHELQPYSAAVIQSLKRLTSTPEQTFPKLRHISLEKRQYYVENPNTNLFVSAVAGIVKASPKLDTYEYKSHFSTSSDDLASQLLLVVDLRNVRTLLLCDCRLNAAALQHFLSYPFRKLQSLRLTLTHADEGDDDDDDIARLSEPALIATVGKSTGTLRALDLSRYPHPETFARFPVCPHVEELALRTFPDSNNFLSRCFPALQVLAANGADVDVLGGSWKRLSPLLGLKTLRLSSIRLDGHWIDGLSARQQQLPLKFFDKFPDVERLRLSYSFLMTCCRVKARGHPFFSKILEGVKHLELCGNGIGWFEERDEDGRSLFAALNGIQILTLVKPNENLLLIPFQDMTSLKVIQFPWGAYLNMTKLLEVAKGLDRVVITNCCTFPRTGEPWARAALDSFFDAAPNAECGCKDWKETSLLS